MESLKELFSLGQENWQLLKDVMAVLGGTGTVLGLILTVLGFKRHWQERRQERHLKRSFDQSVKMGLARDRSEWFASIYHAQQARWTIDNIATMTVQQVCGLMDSNLPDWAVDGWERVLVGDLNRRVKK